MVVNTIKTIGLRAQNRFSHEKILFFIISGNQGCFVYF